MTSNDEHERFTEHWTEVQPVVSHFIHSMVRDSAAAKDVLQSIALVLLRKFSDFDSNRRFLPWAMAIAKFEVLAHRRDHARCLVSFDSVLMDQLAESWVEFAPAVSDEASALQGCVEKLPEQARRMVRLRYADDLNSKEIAKRLNRDAGNVRVMLQRIRLQLRECVERAMRAEGGVS